MCIRDRSNTLWSGPRPTSTPSFILIHPTVCHSTPTSQTGQTDRQWCHSIRRTVLQTVTDKCDIDHDNNNHCYFATVCASTVYRQLFHPARTFCENQLKACCLSASIRHAYQHFFVSKKALITTTTKQALNMAKMHLKQRNNMYGSNSEISPSISAADK